MKFTAVVPGRAKQTISTRCTCGPQGAAAHASTTCRSRGVPPSGTRRASPGPPTPPPSDACPSSRTVLVRTVSDVGNGSGALRTPVSLRLPSSGPFCPPSVCLHLSFESMRPNMSVSVPHPVSRPTGLLKAPSPRPARVSGRCRRACVCVGPGREGGRACRVTRWACAWPALLYLVYRAPDVCSCPWLRGLCARECVREAV